MSIAVKKKAAASAKMRNTKFVRVRVAKSSEIRSALKLRPAEAYKIHKLLVVDGK